MAAAGFPVAAGSGPLAAARAAGPGLALAAAPRGPGAPLGRSCPAAHQPPSRGPVLHLHPTNCCFLGADATPK